MKNSKCSSSGTSACTHGKCLIYGTRFCIDAMPQPGACNIRPCNRKCRLYGTDFCVGGVIKEIKAKENSNTKTLDLKMPEIPDLDILNKLKK